MQCLASCKAIVAENDGVVTVKDDDLEVKKNWDGSCQTTRGSRQGTAQRRWGRLPMIGRKRDVTPFVQKPRQGHDAVDAQARAVADRLEAPGFTRLNQVVGTRHALWLRCHVGRASLNVLPY